MFIFSKSSNNNYVLESVSIVFLLIFACTQFSVHGMNFRERVITGMNDLREQKIRLVRNLQSCNHIWSGTFG